MKTTRLELQARNELARGLAGMSTRNAETITDERQQQAQHLKQWRARIVPGEYQCLNCGQDIDDHNDAECIL